jgi:hypothetical protein
VRLRVHPRAARAEVGWRADGVLAVRVPAPPVEGAANAAACALLAEALGLRRSAVTLVAGARGRDKLVRLAGLTREEVRARLGGAGRVERRTPMKLPLVAGMLAIAALAPAVPAVAEHMTALEPRPESSEEGGASPAREPVGLDLDLRVGADGFRLGGRVVGPRGVYGAWLNGQLRRGGATLDGRLQGDARVYNFKLDTDGLDALGRWLLGL